MRARAQSGFTLIEVMIALAILFGALVMMLSTVTADVQHTQEAKLMSAATGLARAKMLDIEEELLFKGFQESAETMDGDFADDGFPRYSWKATIEKVELPSMQQMQTAEGAQAADPSKAGETFLPPGQGQPSTNPTEAMGASVLSSQWATVSASTEPGRVVSGGPARVGTSWRRSVPGRVADSPFLGCCTREGRSRRSICAGLIVRSFSLKASSNGAQRRW